jgi:LysR family transcriptional regulator for metE and metH
VLRLTTECYTCYDWLPPLLARFTRSHPEVSVRIVVEATRCALAGLMEGAVDVALVTAPVHAKELTLHKVFDDEMLLVVPPDHSLAPRRFVRPTDLAGLRVMLYVEPAESKFWQQFVVPAGVVPPPEPVVVQLTEAAISMVKAGLGVTPLARWAVERELRRGDLAGVRLGERGLRRTWLAATRRSSREPAYLAEFVELVAAHAGPGRAEERRRAAAR